MKILIKGRFLFIAAGVIIMVNLFGCSFLKYEKYSSKDPQIGVTMDYVKGWKFSESRGSHEKYAQVSFLDQNKGAAVLVSLTVREKASMGQENVVLMGKDIISKRKLFGDFKLIAEKNTVLIDKEAVDIEVAYSTPATLEGVNVKPEAFKERIVVVEKGGKVYILRYLAKSIEYKNSIAVFSHMLATLRVK